MNMLECPYCFQTRPHAESLFGHMMRQHKDEGDRSFLRGAVHSIVAEMARDEADPGFAELEARVTEASSLARQANEHFDALSARVSNGHEHIGTLSDRLAAVEDAVTSDGTVPERVDRVEARMVRMQAQLDAMQARCEGLFPEHQHTPEACDPFFELNRDKIRDEALEEAWRVLVDRGHFRAAGALHVHFNLTAFLGDV